MDSMLALVLIGVAIWFYFDRRSKANHKATASKKSVSTPKSVADVVPERFVVFDLETTGLDAEQHEILEIGAIRVDRDGTKHDTFQSLVVTNEPIPTFIQELTGITPAMVEVDGTSLEEALRDFKSFIGDLPLVAFNAKFDKSFIRAAGEKTGIKISNKVSCALVAARKAWPDRKSYKLVDLARDGGVATNVSHRALEDARIAMVVYVSAKRLL